MADLSIGVISDDVRDQFASLLKDVCHDVEVEPHLQPLTGEALNSSAKSWVMFDIHCIPSEAPSFIVS